MTLTLREIVFWVAVAACVVAESAIVGSQARRRAAIWETIWAVLPALALAWVLAVTWGEMHRMDAHEHMNMPAGPSNG